VAHEERAPGRPRRAIGVERKDLRPGAGEEVDGARRSTRHSADAGLERCDELVPAEASQGSAGHDCSGVIVLVSIRIEKRLELGALDEAESGDEGEDLTVPS
jgi:hypothetical protein